MAVTKRVRMARVMVTAMRVPVNKEGEGVTAHGVSNKVGVRRRERRGWRASNGNEGDGNRRQTVINQQQDQQRRVVAGKRASTRQPHDHDGGQR